MDSWRWKSPVSGKNVTVRFIRFVEETPYEVDGSDKVVPVFESSIAIPSATASTESVGSENYYEYPVTLWPKFVITLNKICERNLIIE